MANNNIAFIEKTLPEQLDKVFAQESVTEILVNPEVKLDFVGARTVKVAKLLSTGLTGYARGGHGGSNSRGSAQSTFEQFTLSQERYSEIPLDKLDTEDDAGIVLGHLANEFIRTHVVREMDTYRLSKLASYTNEVLGNRVNESISANTIISKFNAGFRFLAEQNVPQDNQVIYVSPAVMELIRNSSELVKRLNQEDYKNSDVTFTIQTYEGRPIIVVAPDKFYTDCNLLQSVSTSGLPTNKGAIAPTSASKIINFMIVDKRCPIVVKKLDQAKVYDSTGENGAYLGYAGFLLTNLLYHDLFVTDNKVMGIYCSVSTTSATTSGAGLLVRAVAGASGKTKVEAVYTQPNSIIWEDVYTGNSAFTLGASTSALTPITLGGDITPDASHNYFAVGYNGKIVAVSKDYEDDLPKGA